ncbi:MAG: hypothetical protein ACT4NY_25400 [Pseudonocardiales bacterium]
MSNALPQGFRQVGENRVREVVGLGLDELTVGLVIEHRPARTVTDAEHIQVLALMGNEAPVHSDIDQGIVTCRIEGHNQHNRRVPSCTRTFVVPADPARTP